MFEENLDIFTSREFGQAALIDGAEIWGIFDENYEPIMNSNMPAEGKHICFQVQSNHIKDVAHGTEVKIYDRTFEVVNIKPIDDGLLTDLILKEI